MQLQYDEVSKLRNDAEDKYLQASRERTNLQTQLDDLDAEMTEVCVKPISFSSSRSMYNPIIMVFTY